MLAALQQQRVMIARAAAAHEEPARGHVVGDLEAEALIKFRRARHIARCPIDDMADARRCDQAADRALGDAVTARMIANGIGGRKSEQRCAPVRSMQCSST